MNDFRDSRVRDVMTTEVRTVAPGTPLRQAAQMMYDARVSCLLVDMGDPARGFGVLTQKDLLGALADHGSTLAGLSVGEVMTHPTVTIQADQHLGAAVQLMRMVGVRRAPVVEGSRLLGIVTFTDVFRHAIESDVRRASA